jgi:hypothetical protein
MPYYGSTRTVYRTVTRPPEVGTVRHRTRKYGPVLRTSTATVESPRSNLEVGSHVLKYEKRLSHAADSLEWMLQLACAIKRSIMDQQPEGCNKGSA